MRSLLLGCVAILFCLGCEKGNSPSPPEQQTKHMDTIANTINVYPDSVLQTIYGFGGADIIEWTGDLTPDQRITAFSPTTGIGLSIVRLRVPTDSTQFGNAKQTVDVCKSFGGLAIATAWSAPAWMKTNNSTTGGSLKPSAYSAFAAHLRAFNDAVGGLTAISPVNEPNIQVNYESMQMTASEVADFVAAEGDSCGAPIMAPEPFNMDQTYISTYLSNPLAQAKTAFVCGHIYGATPYHLSVTQPVFMTEHFTSSSVSGDDWQNAMQAAKEIHDCITAGWSAYVWWYIRRSYGPISESGNIQKLGYVMAQYARYVRPGDVRIACSAYPETSIYVTAYKSSTALIMVCINAQNNDVYQTFQVNGRNLSSITQYSTTSTFNLQADSAHIQGNHFGRILPAESVSTLVLK